MSLLVHLVLRLFMVVALCLAGAAAWVMVDAHRSIENATQASAERMARHLEGLYWQQLLWRGGMRRHMLLPSPDWATLTTLNLLAPGVCATFAPPESDSKRLCSQVEAVGSAPPRWFMAIDGVLFAPYSGVRRELFLRDRDAGSISVEPDGEAALRQVWSRVSVVVGIAAAMAFCIAALAAVLIGHTLRPAGAIIAGLQELERGNLGSRLPRFNTIELDHIARAVNDLAHRLGLTEAARTALTVRLRDVQEEERRAIARDLHDEFGQGLTATLALASLIENEAEGPHSAIAADARKIGEVQKHLVETLRGTLHRLRSQNIEEVGLEGSLRELVSECNARAGAQTIYRLNLAGLPATLPKRLAVDLYRIAQECLTNASRHGRPTEVSVSIDQGSSETDLISLTVEDDGGGDVARIDGQPGFGVRGMRERLAAIGGRLIIAPAARGIRITALVPKFDGESGPACVPAPT